MAGQMQVKDISVEIREDLIFERQIWFSLVGPLLEVCVYGNRGWEEERPSSVRS